MSNRISYWVSRLKEAQEQGEEEYLYNKYLMSDELDYEECREVYEQVKPLYE